jgi:hypothetical protein
MIRNESLSDRLNKFKNGSQSESQEVQTPILDNTQRNKLYNDLLARAVSLSVVLKIAVYGYALRIILGMNWNVVETTAIGIALHFVLNYIHSLIHNE